MVKTGFVDDGRFLLANEFVGERNLIPLILIQPDFLRASKSQHLAYILEHEPRLAVPLDRANVCVIYLECLLGCFIGRK